MQYAQNYNNSLILFNSIYVEIRNVSFYEEHAEFFDDIQLDREPGAGLSDAYAALTIIEKIYKGSGYDYRT